MKFIVIAICILFSSHGFAESESKPWQGPHTINRVLAPGDSDQKTNYFLPTKGLKKPKIKAPLITTELFKKPDQKFEQLRLLEQKDLSNSAD
jgi:hypothetical protein